MPKYIQPFPGAYQILPDENVNVEAARIRLENFITKLRDYRESNERRNGEGATREFLPTL